MDDQVGLVELGQLPAVASITVVVATFVPSESRLCSNQSWPE